MKLFEPRICVASTRGFRKQVFRCSLYEAEDVLAESANVELIELRPGAGFERLDWLQKRLAYRTISKGVVFANPGLEKVTLKKDYDVFIVFCQYCEELPYVNAIRNRKERCRLSICWLDEIWAASVYKNRHWLSMLREFDHVFIGSSTGSITSVSEMLGQPCSWLPLAVDTLRFSPLRSPPRPIDVLSIGRRPGQLHTALRQLATHNKLFYLHDTFSAAVAQVFDYRQHRELVANLSQRSQYFLVAPGKFDNHSETLGQVEFGSRYYEGAAGGAVLLGHHPRDSLFARMFDWTDAVIDIKLDGSDIVKVLYELNSQPARLKEISSRNIVESLLQHDWVYRWIEMLEIAGVGVPSGMRQRVIKLQAFAERVRSGSMFCSDMK